MFGAVYLCCNDTAGVSVVVVVCLFLLLLFFCFHKCFKAILFLFMCFATGCSKVTGYV